MNYINDVVLYNKDSETVNVIVEICPDTDDKFELVEPGFNVLKNIRKVIGKYPFYYGSFPQTYAGDKDPLDFILFTNKKHEQLDLVKVDVIGAIRTVDAGEQDDKIIVVETDCSLKNVKKFMRSALKFLRTYKGKDADMIIDKKLVDHVEAEKLVAAAHVAWKEHIKPKVITRSASSTKTTKRANRVHVIQA